MKLFWRMLILMLILFAPALAGCDRTLFIDPNASSSSILATPAQNSYLYADKTAASFISWIEATNGTLSGQIQEAFISKDDPTQLQPFTAAFTGVKNGSSVSVTFKGSALDDSKDTTWTGMISGDQVTFTWPANDGTMQTITLTAGTVDDYNSAVSSLKAIAAGTLQQAQEAEADEALKIALQTAIEELQTETQFLADDAFFDDVLTQFSDGWTLLQTDFQQLKNDAAATPADDTRQETIAADLSAIDADFAAIESAQVSLDDRTNQITAGISSLREKIGPLYKVWQEYNAAGLTYQDISPVIADAQNEIINAAMIINNAAGDAAEYAAKSKKIYEDAHEYVSSL